MNSLPQELSRAAPPSAKALRALAIRFQTLLERERTRLAQELHDNLTQKLTVISLELSLLEGNILAEQELAPARLRDKAKELGQIVTDMIQSLRKLKAELRPKVLDEFGLLAALEWQSQEFSRHTGVVCRLKLPENDLALPISLATELFRMFQEIIANIAEHAHAHRITLEVKQSRSWLILKVSDDGTGITRQQIEDPKSLGLLELKERARAVGGEFEIQAAAGVGTTVTIKVPVGLQTGNTSSHSLPSPRPTRRP